jgi:hypothetical protein
MLPGFYANCWPNESMSAFKSTVNALEDKIVHIGDHVFVHCVPAWFNRSSMHRSGSALDDTKPIYLEFRVRKSRNDLPLNRNL